LSARPSGDDLLAVRSRSQCQGSHLTERCEIAPNGLFVVRLHDDVEVVFSCGHGIPMDTDAMVSCALDEGEEARRGLGVPGRTALRRMGVFGDVERHGGANEGGRNRVAEDGESGR
jgi:hypothetical protein